MLRFLIAVAAFLAASPVLAQDEIETVTAKNPAEMVIVLMNAGYDAELSKDDGGDPMIISELVGYPLRVYFYDCDEKTNDGCYAIQLSTGFDRREPWTAEAALELSKTLRFVSVRMDEDGDPYISWDILLGDGIPKEVFLESIYAFETAVVEAATIVFADDPDAMPDQKEIARILFN